VIPTKYPSKNLKKLLPRFWYQEMPRQGHSQNNQPSAFGLWEAGYFGNTPALGLSLTPNLARSSYVCLPVWLHHKNARKKIAKWIFVKTWSRYLENHHNYNIGYTLKKKLN
jgi:hypothetical protein